MSDGRGQIFVSYLQIYCEVISDLLICEPEVDQSAIGELVTTPSLSLATGVGFNPNHLAIREKDGKVFVEGLSKMRIKSLLDLDEVLIRGDKNRNTATTNMNQTSSRSHAALIVTVIIRDEASKPQGGGHESYSESTLVIVDLAGSERCE